MKDRHTDFETREWVNSTEEFLGHPKKIRVILYEGSTAPIENAKTQGIEKEGILRRLWNTAKRLQFIG